MRKTRKGMAMLGCVAGAMLTVGLFQNQLFSSADNMEVKVENMVVEIPEDALAANVSSFLNIRYQPSSDSVVIGKLVPGDLVTYVGETGDWTQVDINGQSGYVYSKYTLRGVALKKYVKNHLDLFSVNAVQNDKSFQAVYKKKQKAVTDVKTVSMSGIVKKTGTLYASKSTASKLKNQYEKVEKAIVDVEALRLRKKASLDGKISNVIGKGTAMNIISNKNPDWVKVEYNGQRGYVAASYIKTTYVNVKKSNILRTVEKGKELTVLDLTEKWVKVQHDDSVAYMQRQNCTVNAITNKADKSVSGWLENNAVCKVQNVKDEMAFVKLSDGSEGYVEADKLHATIAVEGVKIDTEAIEREQQKVTSRLENVTLEGDANVSSDREELVAYAQTFVGGKYVWGGNSLTDGVDCSGFTQQIYLKFGISLHRCSYEQVQDGTEISFDQLQPGDLIFYYKESLGRIGHVAIYIGDGKIVHAQCARTGICISNWNYQTPYKAVRVLKD